MTDIVERLHTIRDHLRTGRFGQREVWEEWLTEAADDIDRLRAALQEIITEADSDDGLTAWDGAEIASRALEPKP